MDTVTIRQLRNDVSRIVRRVRAGERLIVTSNGEPVAEIGPVQRTRQEEALERMYATGELIPPRSRAKPRPATPRPFGGTRTSEEILDELRADRF